MYNLQSSFMDIIYAAFEYFSLEYPHQWTASKMGKDETLHL